MKFLYPDGTIKNESDDEVWKIMEEDRPAEFTSYDEYIQNMRIYLNEDASPDGHLSFTPTGSMLFALLKSYIYNLHTKLGCFYLETPTLINYDHPGVKNQIDKAENPTYHIMDTKTPIVTRTGVLYCQLAMLSQNGKLRKGDKYRFFETPKVFRLEEKILPLKKACEFTMADMHEVCSDLEEAMSEAYEIHQKILEFAKLWGFELYVTAKVLNSFLEEHKEWLMQISKDLKKEIMLVDIDYEVGRYINLEYHINIPDDKPMELSAFQLDFDNPEKFGLRMENGTVPILIHSNFIGSVERFMYVALIRAIEQGHYDSGIAPEQLRIIPNTPDDIEYSLKLAMSFQQQNCRVTVDDRMQLAVEQRVNVAQKNLIPFVLYVENKKIQLTKTVAGITDYKEITGYLLKEQERDGNIPNIASTYPVLISKWPEIFCSKF